MSQSTKTIWQLDILSTGLLKRDPCILQWIITHVLHPRKGGHSRIDQTEVHLRYILQSKVKINWPNYFVARMFNVRDCNSGSSLCYASMITRILKHFRIGVPNLLCTSPSHAQEFNNAIGIIISRLTFTAWRGSINWFTTMMILWIWLS